MESMDCMYIALLYKAFVWPVLEYGNIIWGTLIKESTEELPNQFMFIWYTLSQFSGSSS